MLRKRRPFVWNATNITRSLRAPLVQLFRDYGASVRVVYLETPYEELLQRNKCRAGQLPTGVLEKLIDRLEPPDLSEAPEVRWIET